MLRDHFATAEAAVEKLIDRGREKNATEHERWVAWSLLNSAHFRQRLTEQLARRHW